jgi:endonuclease G, mitochondrial
MKQFSKYLLFFVLLVLVFSCSPKDEPTILSTGRDNNLALGNPSAASTAANNYLMEKPQFALSYNNSKATASWVSWHLNSAWKGAAQRQDDFRPDTDLPTDWYAVKTSDYTNSGFDRGHLCPSDDRDGSQTDNSATFLMTNIIPQAANNNQQTWRFLEEYCRKLAAEGNEMYIIAGGYGSGGINRDNDLIKTIANGKINVPARVWKVILVLPNGGNDLSRISTATRVIAVDMPNTQDVTDKKWYEYRVTTNAIESKTGYNFFDKLPTAVQDAIEGKTDNVKIE